MYAILYCADTLSAYVVRIPSDSATEICTHIVDEELEEALKSFRQPTAVAV